VLWGLAPLAQIPIVIAVFNLSGKSTRSVPTLVIPQAVLAYVVILLLWGLGRLMRQARDLQTTLRRLTAGQDEPDTKVQW
jgi:hypothetical protein